MNESDTRSMGFGYENIQFYFNIPQSRFLQFLMQFERRTFETTNLEIAYDQDKPFERAIRMKHFTNL